MADGKSIVLHQGGRIRRVDVASGQVSTIPFTARVHRVMSEQVWVKKRLTDGPFDVRFIRWASEQKVYRRKRTASLLTSVPALP